MNTAKKFGVTVIAAMTLTGFGLVTATSADAVAPPQPRKHKTPTCQGKKATIVGKGERCAGRLHRDVIVLTRASKVLAGGGNDLICGPAAMTRSTVAREMTDPRSVR